MHKIRGFKNKIKCPENNAILPKVLILLQFRVKVWVNLLGKENNENNEKSF